MAASVTETGVYKMAGNFPALTMVVGTASAASVTEFIIKPGSNDTNIEGSAGVRKIMTWGFSCYSNEEAAEADRSYDATQDGDIVTVTCQANATYNWWVLGEDNGA